MRCKHCNCEIFFHKYKYLDYEPSWLHYLRYRYCAQGQKPDPAEPEIGVLGVWRVTEK